MTREEFRELTQEYKLEWNIPREFQEQIVVCRYAVDRGYYWKAIDDRSLPDDHPEAAMVYQADYRNPDDVPDDVDRKPHWTEPQGIRWHLVG